MIGCLRGSSVEIVFQHPILLPAYIYGISMEEIRDQTDCRHLRSSNVSNVSRKRVGNDKSRKAPSNRMIRMASIIRQFAASNGTYPPTHVAFPL